MKTLPEGPTRAVADFVATTRLDDVPPRAIASAKTIILDTLGVSLAASELRVGQIITEYVADLGGRPQARIIGSKVRTSAPLATLANGTLAHALDFDDRHHLSTHSLPAALAIAEAHHLSGRRLLEAYVIAREVAARITDAIEAKRPEHAGPTYRGWYRVGVVAPISGAVATAKLLDLDARTTAIAIGIAAGSASGLRRNQGTMAKALDAGSAGDGVRAALLARAGFTADPAIIESPLGLFTALCLPGECEPEAVMKGLGTPYDLDQPPGIKPFPSCAPSHRPIAAVLQLRESYGFGAGDVDHIETDLHTFSLFRADPDEALAGGYCLPYLLAVALIDGEMGVEQISDTRIRDPQVRKLMDRVVPPTAPPASEWAVTVVLCDGRRLTATIENPPTLTTPEQIHAKYRDCASRVLSATEVDRLQAQTDDLERIQDVNELVISPAGDG